MFAHLCLLFIVEISEMWIKGNNIKPSLVTSCFLNNPLKEEHVVL